MKHPDKIAVVFQRIALLLLFAVTVACLEKPSAKRCNDESGCPVGYECFNTECVQPNRCGNGILDVQQGEECDDGNVQDQDGCRRDCLSNESCGNGFRDVDEACDDGRDNGSLTSKCDKSCQNECGNGVLKETEDCDNGLFRVTCLDFGFDRGMLACDDDCVPDTRDCDFISWTPEDRVADTGDLRGLWGDTNGNVFAVGEDESGSAAAILHYKSPSWGADKPGENPGPPLHDVWGSSPDDVFAVGSSGRALQYDGSTWIERAAGLDPRVTLRGVWTAGVDGDVIAVGDDATIVRYRRSAEAWTRESLPSSVPEDTALEAVWGDGKAQLYAVGHAGGRGVIVRHTGQGWELDAPQLATPGLLDIWGSANGDVFVVGEDGIILRRERDSDMWSIMTSQNTLTLHSLWGSTADRVFAVGERGTVLLYDGEQWSTLEAATDLTLTAVWGTPFLGIAAAAEDGRILRYHGWSWIAVPARPEGGAIRSMWADGLNHVHVLTKGVLYPQRFDGSTWSLMSEGFAALDCLGTSSSGGPSPLRHLWGRTADVLIAVGVGMLILRSLRGRGKQQPESPGRALDPTTAQRT